MNARAFDLKDISRIKEIHEKHYKYEFNFPNFLDKFICAFVIEEDDTIICAGGVRTFAESILITDKDIPLKSRVRALKETLNVSKYITKNAGYDQLHASIQDEDWLGHLKRYGFQDCRGRAIYLGL